MSNYFDFTFFTLRFDLQTKLFLRTRGDIRNANIDRKIALSLFSHKTKQKFLQVILQYLIHMTNS